MHASVDIYISFVYAAKKNHRDTFDEILCRNLRVFARHFRRRVVRVFALIWTWVFTTIRPYFFSNLPQQIRTKIKTNKHFNGFSNLFTFLKFVLCKFTSQIYLTGMFTFVIWFVYLLFIYNFCFFVSKIAERKNFKFEFFRKGGRKNEDCEVADKPHSKYCYWGRSRVAHPLRFNLADPGRPSAKSHWLLAGKFEIQSGIFFYYLFYITIFH